MLPIESPRWGVFARDRQQTDSAPLTDRRRAKQRAKLESPSLRLQALPRSRFGLTCTRLLPQPHKPPFADREPDTRADGGSRIRSATLSPYPQPMPSTPDHYLVNPHESRERGSTTIPGGGWQRGDEDDRWISVEEMPGAVTGSKDTDRHSIPLLHHAIDAVIRRGVHSSD